MAKVIERRIATLEETAKRRAARETKRDDLDTARRIHFVLASSRAAELKGAPADPAAIRIWRLLQPYDATTREWLRRGLVRPGGMDQLRPLCIERGQDTVE